MVTQSKYGPSTRCTVLCHGPGHTPWIVNTFGLEMLAGVVVIVLGSKKATLFCAMGNACPTASLARFPVKGTDEHPYNSPWLVALRSQTDLLGLESRDLDVRCR